MTATFDVHARQRIWSPLAAEEIPVIVNVVSDACSQLDAINSHIQSLENKLGQLKMQRDAIRRHLDAHRSLQAPIRSLPLELLSEIFMLCSGTVISYDEEHEVIEDTLDSDSDSDLNDNSEYLTTGTTNISMPQLALSQVCSTWNNLIDTLTRAWSNISLSLLLSRTLPYARSYKLNIRRIARTVVHVIERSRTSPLYISIAYSAEHGRAMDTELMSVLHPLLRQCYRWKSGNLSLDFNPSDRSAFSELNSPMPILESLSFSLEDSRRPILTSTRDDCYFSLAPSLRSVVIHSNLALERLQIKWTDIHTLTFGGRWADESPSMSSVKRILSKCKSLHTLNWEVDLEEDEGGSITDPVVLSVLSIAGNENIAELLPHVLLPRLQTFDLVAQLPYHSTGKSFLSIFDGYRSKITSLTAPCTGLNRILGRTHSIESAFAELGSLPALQKLMLAHRSRDSPVPNIAEIPHCFPMLKSLTYEMLETNSADSVFSLLRAFHRPGIVGDGSSGGDVPVLLAMHLKLPRVRMNEDQILALKGFKAGGSLKLLRVQDQTGYLDL